MNSSGLPHGLHICASLQGVGVYRASGHEHLNGCFVVPVIGIEDSAVPEHSGQILQLYGRRIAPNNKLTAAQPRHLCLPRALRGVWNEAALVADRKIILTEAPIDAMTFWSEGHRNVIAAYAGGRGQVRHSYTISALVVSICSRLRFTKCRYGSTDCPA